MGIIHRQVCFFISFLLTAPIAIAQLRYQVSVTNQPEVIELQLTLPPNPHISTKLAPRGTAWGLAPQVQHVRCADQLLAQDEDGYWIVPVNCTVVTWEIRADHVNHEGADASEQRTLVVGSPPWYLLAEPTSILRPQNEDSLIATIENSLSPDLLLGATRVKLSTSLKLSHGKLEFSVKD